MDNQSEETKSTNGGITNIYSSQQEKKSKEVNELVEYIKNHQPISLWKLSKELKFSHSKLFYMIRDLEFSGVLYSEILLNENNRSERMIYCGKRK